MEKKKTNPLKIVLATHRASYMHIKTPSQFEDGEPKYDATFLIPKDHPDVERIEAVIEKCYKENKESKFGGLPLTSKKLWNPLRDGDDWLEEHPEAKEYEGMYFLKAASKNQPTVYDRNKEEIIDLDEEVYSGAFFRGVIVCYPFAKKGNKGFGFFLNSLMKMKDGERLGGFAADPDDYDNGEDDEDIDEKPKRRASRRRDDDEDEAPKA